MTALWRLRCSKRIAPLLGTPGEYEFSAAIAAPIPALQGAAVEGIFRGMKFDYNQYFERRREICGGELVIKGTRVTIRTLLASLAEGASAAEIAADFPT